MKFSLVFHTPWPEGTDPGRLIDEMTEQIVFGEQLGFHGTWMAEHHFSRYGLASSSIVLASSIAAKTRTIRMGMAVLVPPLHNPIRLAEETAMLDQISGGRLDVGFGRGSARYEYAGYGVDREESQGRFREAIEVVCGLWTAQDYCHDGPFYRIQHANLVPPPVQKPHPPVYIAATRTPETLDFAAASGHPLLVGTVPDTKDALDLCRRFLAQAAAAGNLFSISQIPFGRYLHVAPTDAKAQANTRGPMDWVQDMIQWRGTFDEGSEANQRIDDFRHRRSSLPPSFQQIYDNRAFFGTPDAVSEKIAAIQSEGIELFGCGFAFGGIEHAQVMRSMELFAKEVMPQFQDSPAESA
jgi:alkanesulfonate monooxygenase SsuD/methylene tetrahydromethanopterin reductase-like flavin-dependent oxidoreductase (luciferase family)